MKKEKKKREGRWTPLDERGVDRYWRGPLGAVDDQGRVTVDVLDGGDLLGQRLELDFEVLVLGLIPLQAPALLEAGEIAHAEEQEQQGQYPARDQQSPNPAGGQPNSLYPGSVIGYDQDRVILEL